MGSKDTVLSLLPVLHTASQDLHVPPPLLQVFAMLASVESVVPILGSQIYSKLYNYTKPLSYPWPGGSGCMLDRYGMMKSNITTVRWFILLYRSIV